MTIPAINSNEDIFAQAETGSGKTGSFAIPIIHKLMTTDASLESKKAHYVVLSPTRELAQQTHKVFNDLGHEHGIKSVSVIGGESIDKQQKELEAGCHVLVATPGRLVDLIKQKIVSLENATGIVFDEADRLFDMGFQKDIDFTLSKLPKSRQLIMVSATSNREVMRTAYKHGSEPREIVLNHDSLLVDHIDHKLAMMTKDEKIPFLVHLLRQQEDAYAIVFCNTQFQTHLVAEWLKAMEFKAMPISGRLAQNKRTKLLKDFRSKQTTILVCTDVAARGLDIKNVNLVVNYDLPSEAANYVHRIGRTGRAGEDGKAISLCAHEDCQHLDAIYDLIDAKIEKMKLTNDDFATDIVKKPYIDKKTLKVSQSTNRNPQPREKKPRAPKVEKTNNQNTTVEKVSESMENTDNIDRRFFETTSTSYKDATQQALNFFRMNEPGMLNHEVLSKGRKKFFFFGPRETTYKFSIKPIYKKLLLPYLIEILKLADLDLFVRVSFKEPHLRVSFSGKDEGLLLKNKGELLRSFEQIIKIYLQKRIVLHQGIKFNINVPRNKRPDSKNQGLNEDNLIKIAEALKTQVLENQEPAQSKTLSPGERRIIHQHFQDDKQVTTSSVGDGRFKKVEVSLLNS